MTDATTMYPQVTQETGAARVIEESLRRVRALQESLRRLISEVIPEDVDLIEPAAPPGQNRRGRRRGRTKRTRTRRARAPTDPEPPPGPTAWAAGPDHSRDSHPGVLTAPLFVMVAEAARALGLSPRQVRRMVAAGKLVGHAVDPDLVAVAGVAAAISPSHGAARFTAVSCNGKLSPVDSWRVPGRTRPAIKAAGPFVATTDASISATCPGNCPFKANGCYASSGLTRFPAERLDAAAKGFTAEQVIAEEVQQIDRAFRGGPIPQDGARGGRDLRLHVSGDVRSTIGAYMLGDEAERWVQRRGGASWTYTHAWREIPHEAWRSAISVLASVERPEDIEVARAAGYAAAITLEQFPSDRAFRLSGTTARMIPCPAETRGRTCVECRLCLDDKKLLERDIAIAFALHGPGAKLAREQLVQLRLENNGRAVSPRPGEFSSARGNKRRGAVGRGGPR